jgi:predicted anti-sigma-YlaC factor YlaD
MTCEEFAMAGLELGPSAEAGPLQLAAREHLRNCPHCAALHENWQTLRDDLQVLGVASRELEAPSRVEMRLRQQFRIEHGPMRTRRTAATAAWALAAAAVLVGAVSWINWRHREASSVADRQKVLTATESAASNSPPAEVMAPAAMELGDVVVAANLGDFALLPGAIPPSFADATVVRVQVQRSALTAFGLTVNEEHGSDWIQVDLLVGDDGVPQAVQLPQTTD